jgi:predicted enzyme related to lactoylglutathione lyase
MIRLFDCYRNIESKNIMSRLHLHVSVPDLDQAVGFYSTLFNAPPSVIKQDYAKWSLDDPSVNFAISARTRAAGIDHIGIQVDSSDELATLAGRLKAAGSETFDQDATTCCYAKSDKSWVVDPVGLRWETFFTHGESTAYGEDEVLPATTATACCPADIPKKACC